MPFFICVPALMVLVSITTMFSMINLVSKATSTYTFDCPTTMDKVYVYVHMIILSFFIA